MAGSRDPEIKLFGKTIQILLGVVSEAIGEESNGDDDKVPSNKEASPEPTYKDDKAPNSTEIEKNDEPNILTNEGKINPNSSPENLKADEEQNDANNNTQDKSTKKPDKILPCPRCNSMDTKFCYFNNYNVNQPRHFCKNCQRYWTAGGSMRNVPVGAGRRKSKCFAANHHYPHITIPDCVRADHESIHHLPPLKSNGTVLSFGSDSPLCESMDSVPNVVEKTMTNLDRNVEEKFNGSSNLNEEVNRSTNSNWHGFPPNVPYLNGTPWPYQFGHPPLAFPFYPMTAYWSMPWLLPPLSTSPSSGFSCSGLNSQTLGKHSREGNLLNHSNSDMGDSPKPKNCIWIPKTTRADDPENAANCSLWETMGFKNDKADLISKGGGLFKAFQSNGSSKAHLTGVSQALLANPAALSRSFNFQESS